MTYVIIYVETVCRNWVFTLCRQRRLSAAVMTSNLMLALQTNIEKPLPRKAAAATAAVHQFLSISSTTTSLAIDAIHHHNNK
eukprot:1817814-Amphidinium_carterae.1